MKSLLVSCKAYKLFSGQNAAFYRQALNTTSTTFLLPQTIMFIKGITDKDKGWEIE